MRLKSSLLPLLLVGCALPSGLAQTTPTITSYSPTSVAAGSAGFTLTLAGNNFCNLSKVVWNGSNLTTAYSSPQSISATVPANLVAGAETVSITVATPLGACTSSGTSPAISFVVAAVSSTPNSAISIQPALFRPRASAGSTTPVMNSINIRNVNGAPLTGPLTTGVFTVAGGGWLNMIPQTTGDLKNGVLRFTTDPTGLAPGSYLGYIVYPGLGGNSGFAEVAKPRAVTTQCNQVSTAVVFTVGNPVLTFNPLNPMVAANAVDNTINVTVNAISGLGASQIMPMLVTATTNDGAGAPCWLSIAPLNVQLQTGTAFQATASSANLPAGSHIGLLTANAGGQTASDAVVFRNAAPGQQYLDVGTNPVITIDPNTFAGSIQVASVPASLPLPFTATCNGCAGARLTATCSGCSAAAGQITGTTPANLTVTVTDLSLLNPGQASMTISSSMAASVSVPVALGPVTLVSDGIVTSGQTRLAIPGAGAQVIVGVAGGCPWLTASADSLFAPLNVNLSVNPSGLAAGTYACSLLLGGAGGGGSPVTVPLTLNLQATTATQAVIPQLADGGGWKTTITLVNLDTAPAPWTITAYGDSGALLNLNWLAQGAPTRTFGIIPPGGSQTLQTSGAGSSTVTGWAQLQSPNRVGGTAIFAFNGQEAAVPILRTTQPTQYFPFDNNPGLSLGVAVAVPQGSSASEMSAWSTRNQNGVALTMPQPITLPPNGHTSFNLQPIMSSQAADLRGVAQFNTLDDPMFGLGIRGRTVGNTIAFTSIEAQYTQPDAAQIVSHVADGATWKTTIILVNTDSVPANYTVNFWHDDGTAFPLPIVGASPASTVTGTIAVGGTATIESTGAAAALTQGWAEVLSGQSVGGSAIFQWQQNGQEAAVPFLSSGGNKLVFPFDNGNNLALGIALANPSLNADTTVTVIIRDQSGNQLGSAGTIQLPRHGHTAFNPVIPANGMAEQLGTIEFDSPSVPIYGLGIRFNAGAFTSIRGLPK